MQPAEVAESASSGLSCSQSFYLSYVAAKRSTIKPYRLTFGSPTLIPIKHPRVLISSSLAKTPCFSSH